MSPNPNPPKPPKFNWKFLATLLLYVKKNLPRIAEISSIEITACKKTINGKTYDYKVEIIGKDAKKADFDLKMDHIDICTWEKVPPIRRKRRT